MEIELLKIIKESMDKQNVNALSYPTIDRLCLKKLPDLVYENKLILLINSLITDNLIEKSKKGGIVFTQKGLDFLEKNSEE